MSSLTVVVGDEEFLVARAVGSAAAAHLGDGRPLREALTELDAREATVDVVAGELSPSLFGERRVVVVRAVQDAAAGVVDVLVAHGSEVDAEVAVVAVHAGGAKGKAALDALKRAAADVVSAPKVKTPRDREQIVTEEVARAGGSIDREAAAELVAAVGSDLRELVTSAVQLVSDCGRRVTLEHVTAYHRGRAESTGFAVADRAVEGDLNGALETFRWALATGLDPVLVSSSLASNLRTIAVVAGAGRGSPDSLAGPLGLPPWKIRRAQSWLRRWDPAGLAAAVAAVADADAQIKGDGADSAFAAERAVVAVAAACSDR